MKNIQDINLDEYCFYHLAETDQEVTVEFFSSEGYLEVENYDLISTNAGTLVAFKQDMMGIHEYSYILNGKRIHFQAISFNFVKNFIGLETPETFGFFAFMNSVLVEKDDANSWSSEVNGIMQRCDYGKYGVFPYYPGSIPYGIKKIRNVLDIAGVGHIIYVDTTSDEDLVPEVRSQNTSSLSLSGMIKTVWEWSKMCDEPFNSLEQVAINSKEFLERLQISNSILDEILEFHPPMRVARYLGGENRLGYVFDEKIENPLNFINYYKTKIRFKTLKSLKENHINGHLLDDELIDLELNSLKRQITKHLFAKEIYNFDSDVIVREMNSLEMSDMRKNDLRCLYEDYKDLIV